MAMAGLIKRRARRRARRPRYLRWLPEVALVLVALAGYVFYLSAKEERMRADLQAAITSDPAYYLENLRIRRGFDAFLEAYARMEMADGLSADAPEFLIGRWALYDHELRVNDRYRDPSCRPSLVIENGRITLPEEGPARPVSYGLRGNVVEVLEQGQPLLKMKLVASGINLHHLEIQGLGGILQIYAYRCD